MIKIFSISLFIALNTLNAFAAENQFADLNGFIDAHPPRNYPLKMIDPVLFEPSDQAGFIAFFRENGYVVLDHVSQAKNRDELVALIDDIVAKNIPWSRRLGFMDLYHDNTLAQLRQEPALYQVFTNLFETEQLSVVFDRVMYWNTSEGELPLPPHVDQNPINQPDFSNVQGMLALRDMNEDTGTLALVPQSPQFFLEYQPWTKLKDGFIEYQGNRSLEFIGLRLREGQIVIWDSRTTHSRFRGVPKKTRYAALITYTPAVTLPELVDLRRKYFREGTGWHNYEAGLRATARPRCEQSLRQNEEQLTELGRKLYGLDSW